MELKAIVDALTAPGLEQGWRDTLTGWEDATEAQRDAALSHIMFLRDEFVQAARDIDDPESLDMVAAIRYIELKSHWIMLNTQVNYVLVCKGRTDMGLAYRASLVSQLLESLERLIDARDIDRIIEFLSEPVAQRAA